MPIILEGNSPAGGIFLCWNKATAVPRGSEAVLRLIGKDLVSQLKLTKQNTDLTYLTELYTLITETNQDLIFAKDKEFRLVIANRRFLELYPPEMRDKVIGYTTLESYPPEEVEKFLANDVAAFKLGRSDVIEKITFPSGQVRIINTVKTRFETTSGEPYILCVSHDITEKEQLIERLKKSNSDLDEFAYVASHDLKSPLNAIKRLVSFIEEDSSDNLDAMSKKHFDMIKSRADRMLKLLSDLLDFARIGRESQQFELINLKNMVENCAELLDMPSQFSLEVQDKDVVLPRVPLELIIINLVSNAIKHHDKPLGKVIVNCVEAGAYYLIDVIDDGPGIQAGMFEKIFEKFQTLKPRDQIEGSGLGLSMVKKTIDHYGGSINVKSEGSRGAQFSLKWPKEHTEVPK